MRRVHLPPPLPNLVNRKDPQTKELFLTLPALWSLLLFLIPIIILKYIFRSVEYKPSVVGNSTGSCTISDVNKDSVGIAFTSPCHYEPGTNYYHRQVPGVYSAFVLIDISVLYCCAAVSRPWRHCHWKREQEALFLNLTIIFKRDPRSAKYLSVALGLGMTGKKNALN